MIIAYGLNPLSYLGKVVGKMNKKGYTCLCISDFNIDNFVGYLRNDTALPTIAAAHTSFGQVIQTLLNENLEYWQQPLDFAVIWTQPQSILETFKQALNYQTIRLETLLTEVDDFATLLAKAGQRVNYVFVPTWILPTDHRGLGMLDVKHSTGLTHLLLQINLRLAEQLQSYSNIFLLNSQRWVAASGKRAFNPKLWYMAKIAFGNPVFKEAVADIKVALAGLAGNARKLIVVDLDDTLWGGIVGDLGWENLQLGGHDPEGEAFVDFQTALKALTNRGIILGIVSKNDEAVALETIKNHPEMVLKQEDFAGWKINWRDKAQNVAELVSELNLGLQSTVFIDDNPIERARVKEALPEVLVPEWPVDKMLYTKTLLSMTCFDTPTISREDAKRAKMYATERRRSTLKTQVGSLDEWLKTLGITINVEALNSINLPRTIQLLNKTNQMNLTTRRLNESELLAWLEPAHRNLWTFRVLDKFGDSGLTGIISLEAEEEQGRIVDFVLSCRVMGRKVEETMLATVIDYAHATGLDKVYAVYQPTAKNKPCLDFWKRSGFDQEADDIFCWKTGRNFPLPDQVTVKSEIE